MNSFYCLLKSPFINFGIISIYETNPKFKSLFQSIIMILQKSIPASYLLDSRIITCYIHVLQIFSMYYPNFLTEDEGILAFICELLRIAILSMDLSIIKDSIIVIFYLHRYLINIKNSLNNPEENQTLFENIQSKINLFKPIIIILFSSYIKLNHVLMEDEYFLKFFFHLNFNLELNDIVNEIAQNIGGQTGDEFFQVYEKLLHKFGQLMNDETIPDEISRLKDFQGISQSFSKNCFEINLPNFMIFDNFRPYFIPYHV